MSKDILNVEPKEVWKNFYELNQVPRPSKNEDRVISFLISFAKKNGLDFNTDKIGNLVIYKDSTHDMYNRETVVLQSHVDMVHEKNNDTEFDFLNSPINMYVDGDWIKAQGTTLGADNGLGVATIMALLESKNISHPKIEALFTIDEETGMTGAINLSETILTGNILLNLDTEEDDEICIGCAGGIDISVKRNYDLIEPPKDTVPIRIVLDGLTGGHSGAEIHKGLGNSNKILFEILNELDELFKINIAVIEGGGLRNAIPRESNIVILINNRHISSAEKLLENQKIKYSNKFSKTDPNLNLKWIFDLKILSKLKNFTSKCLNNHDTSELIKAIQICPNGVYSMSKKIDGLVETSNNLANIKLIDGNLNIMCLTRSSLDDSKFELSKQISLIFEKISCNISFSGGYTGWEPNENSPILEKAKQAYEKLFSSEPKINVIHAGLECGIIGSHYPKMDMISFGPTILGAHSPDEKASISSTQKFWKFFKEVINNTPEKTN